MTPESSPRGGVEPLVGVHAVRTFRISEDGHLLPLAEFSEDWRGGVCVARCTLHEDHRPPVEDCTCGIYSYRDPGRLLEAGQLEAGQLVAVIALEGQAIEGVKGWRCQAARVVAVWLAPRSLPVAVKAALRANLPGVRFYRERDEMIAAYPDLGPACPTGERDEDSEGAGGNRLPAGLHDFAKPARRVAGFLAPWALFTLVYGIPVNATPTPGMPVPMRGWAVAAIAISVAAVVWFAAGQILQRRVGGLSDRPWQRLAAPRAQLVAGMWLYWQLVSACTIVVVVAYHEPVGPAARHAVWLGYCALSLVGMIACAVAWWPRLPKARPYRPYVAPPAHTYSPDLYPILVGRLERDVEPPAGDPPPREVAVPGPATGHGRHRRTA